MRVLVVEDHQRLAAAIASGLRHEGMAVDLAFDGADALAHTTVTALSRRGGARLTATFAGIVHAGDQVCRTLVQRAGNTRVLMLTASDTIRDRVSGLELGADDYLGKPFDFSELVARVRALARRASPALPPLYVLGDLSLDPSRRVASRGDQRLELSPKEFAVLEHLLAADGRAVSSEELLERVWDEAANPFTTTVKTTVARLRAKLGDPSPLIATVREGGYSAMRRLPATGEARAGAPGADLVRGVVLALGICTDRGDRCWSDQVRNVSRSRIATSHVGGATSNR